MRKESAEKTKRSRFTRMCMGDAFVALLQEKPYCKISVSDIVKRAGVSRMTYYHYYDTKEDVVRDYIKELVAEYAAESERTLGIGSLMDYQHILFSLKFFDRYDYFFVTLAKAGLNSMINDAVNIFMRQQYVNIYQGSPYELYFYAGAMVNIFLQWEQNNKDVSPEELAQIIVNFVGKREEKEELWA